MLIRACLFTTLTLAASLHAAVAAEPKIAVTDLAYEERVSQYIRVVSASSKSNLDARSSVRDTPYTYAERGSMKAKSESSYNSIEGSYTYIEQTELRSYTADLKGAMLKGGGVRLVQAKPYSGKPTEQVFDIIARIKQGYFPGADYVLFGTVSSIQFRQEAMPLTQGTSGTATLSLDLVTDFSLINTRTYEVKAAFSATGSGQDVKIIARPGDRVVLNRGKVISETSKSLAETAYAELLTQFNLPRTGMSSQPVTQGSKPPLEPKVEPVKTY
jgi:hypothetical protein